ncbi:protein FAM107B-like [Alligator sinensis]|uniref:Protein FAM107B-like n=1 Tax=Alligator sinensis TaxID=38654 RepID=A0A3Q0FZX9_ALLSI|nr:protein FAM107B-like [Alligator sinensis]
MVFSLPEAGRQGFEPGTYRTVSGTSGLIEPKKLPNPVKESKNHRDLHRELLFSHKRGLLPEHKPELQKALETRRLKQLKQKEESQRPLTDLEKELRKRHQKLEEYEQELALKQDQESRPEFILVKESLKKIKLSAETGMRQT